MAEHEDMLAAAKAENDRLAAELQEFETAANAQINELEVKLNRQEDTAARSQEALACDPGEATKG